MVLNNPTHGMGRIGKSREGTGVGGWVGGLGGGGEEVNKLRRALGVTLHKVEGLP